MVEIDIPIQGLEGMTFIVASPAQFGMLLALWALLAMPGYLAWRRRALGRALAASLERAPTHRTPGAALRAQASPRAAARATRPAASAAARVATNGRHRQPVGAVARPAG